MALDRQSIARRDFPPAARGYDPAAVDAHLAAIADELEELRRRPGAGGALAAQTNEQVRAIIEAAEASAAGIRDAAGVEARDHVARVAEAADALRERVDALERELTGMLGAVRSGAERLRRELDEVAAGTAQLAAASASAAGGGAQGGASPAIARSALGATVGAVAGGPVEDETDDEPALAAVEEAPEGESAGRSGDVEGALLVAFQMASEGRPREEIDRVLARDYDLPDRAALLEQVFAAGRQD